jgi:hypothetical protein
MPPLIIRSPKYSAAAISGAALFISMAVMYYIDFETLGKQFWLLDTYEGLVECLISEEEHRLGILPGGYSPCYEEVVKTFGSIPGVNIRSDRISPAARYQESPPLCSREAAAIDAAFDKIAVFMAHRPGGPAADIRAPFHVLAATGSGGLSQSVSLTKFPILPKVGIVNGQEPVLKICAASPIQHISQSPQCRRQ